MKRLDVNYYITKDETVLYAVAKENWLVVASFDKKIGKWIALTECNELNLTHSDDIYPYGEYGALLITHGVYPDSALQEQLDLFKQVMQEADESLAFSAEVISELEERNKK